MTSRRNTKSLHLAAAGAAAVFVLSGCAAGAHLARTEASPRDLDKASRENDRAVAMAERAVERGPNSASLRAELGVAYLQSGRFASAMAMLDDAMKLGDNTPRTALSLALAKVGAGQGREAVAILDDWRDSIPAADLGLALALAGETGRGVAVLADALRAGDSTAKLRQNLAYGYALDGRWSEARTMMAQDVPADQIDQRITQWALQAKPDSYQQRVSALLGAPVRSDPGLPQRLALANSATVEQLAAEATATSAQAARPVAAPVSYNSELPAVGDAPVPSAVAAVPVLASAAQPVVSGPVVQSTFAHAFTAPTIAPQYAAPAARKARPARTVRVVLPAAKPVVQRKGTHLVQLGSYASPQGARRGWGVLTARNPKLREYRMVITPAVVGGRNYWRVAAAGFDGSTARGMCSSVKVRGGVCFAYGINNAPAGALPVPAQAISGPQLARRR